jgi:predicted Zn-dependent peptidase
VLPNGLKLYSLSEGAQEVIRIDLVFNSGTSSVDNSLIPNMALSMLKEGTSKRNAAELADAIDAYGAFFEADIDKDYATITLYSLTRHVEKTLPVVMEMIVDASFPEREFEIKKSNRLQKFRLNSEKVSFIAGKRFQEKLFEETSYHSQIEESSYHSLQQPDLVAFYEKHIQHAPFQVFVSGKFSEEIIASISSIIGNHTVFPVSEQRPLDFSNTFIPGNSELLVKADAIQSAIRIGRRTFNREHPDYFGMKVLTTILGGYFGSRLMTNIREDKGYTYGIGAGLTSLKHDGYFYISTEVGVDVCQNALKEIYFEIAQIRDHLVSNEELELVKSYMLGGLLKSFDGPFERMERSKAAILFGMELSYYKQFAQAIRQIQPDRIQELAVKWLQQDDLFELVAGRTN